MVNHIKVLDFAAIALLVFQIFGRSAEDYIYILYSIGRLEFGDGLCLPFILYISFLHHHKVVKLESNRQKVSYLYDIINTFGESQAKDYFRITYIVTHKCIKPLYFYLNLTRIVFSLAFRSTILSPEFNETNKIVLM